MEPIMPGTLLVDYIGENKVLEDRILKTDGSNSAHQLDRRENKKLKPRCKAIHRQEEQAMRLKMH